MNMKYTIKTEVEAVLLIDKDAESIQGIADLLPGVPHFFTDEGLIFPNPDVTVTDEVIPYGMYIIKENHGISAMTAELFENISERVDVPYYDGTRGENFNIGKLREYLNQLPPGVSHKEVWFDTGNAKSNQCLSVRPFNKRSHDDFDIIMETGHG